ncbi:hypothetical protein ACOSQ2_022805 [Xanthoceras sorbifolium]
MVAKTVGPQADCSLNHKKTSRKTTSLEIKLSTLKDEFFNQDAKPAFFDENEKNRPAIWNSLRASFFTKDLGGSSTTMMKEAGEDNYDGSIGGCDKGGIGGDYANDNGGVGGSYIIEFLYH